MLKPKCSVFRYFVSTRAQKANPTVNFLVFPSVKFHKIWQAGSKYFTLVRACFSGKPVRPIFLHDSKRQKIKKVPLQTLLFSCLKIYILLDVMCCKVFSRFQWRKLKNIINKALKTAKNTFILTFIIQY